MNATVARLTARTLLGGRRLLLLAALPAILVALCVVVRLLAGPDPAGGAALMGGFALGTMVPLLGLILGTGAIAPEIDDGSIVYLLAKPLSRHTIARTKFAVAVAVMVAVAVAPTLVGGLILFGSADGVALSYAVGAAIAGIGYCAVFLLLGVVTRNAVVVGLVYALVWESLIGGFVPGAQTLSVQQWALAITQGLMGDAASQLGVSSAVTLGTALPLLVVVTFGGVWYAGARLRSLRLATTE